MDRPPTRAAPPAAEPAARRAAPPAWQSWAAALLIGGATALTYLGSLDGGFVSDDQRAIAANPLLRALDAASLRAIFTSFDDANYIPVKVLSLAVDQRLFGPAPFGYHLTNLLLHVVCALLAWRLVLRLGSSAGAALLTTLLWALHPVQVESVAWMSERKNVLSTAFFLAALLVYLRWSAGGRAAAYLGVLALFVLALLSKMSTVVLPAICLAYEALVARRLDRRAVLAALPLLAIGAAVVWVNLGGSGIHGSTPFHGGSPLVTWLTSATVVFRYLGIVLWPSDLRSVYVVPLYGSPADSPVALALAGLAALSGLLVWLAIRARREAFWLAWFAITLAPMLNIVPFPTLMQDRYLYVPLLGLLAAPIGAVDGWLSAPRARRAAAGLAAALAVAWAMVSVREIEAWHDELSLWRDWAVEDWYLPPDSLRAAAPGVHAQRLAVIAAAARAAPDSVVLRHNHGALLLEGGAVERALAELEAAERLAGARASGPLLLNLGRAYLRAGDDQRALETLQRAVAVAPYSFYAHLNLARAALRRGRLDVAAAALDACARTRPAVAARLTQLEREQLERLRAAGS